jgi:hypothetical protein
MHGVVAAKVVFGCEIPGLPGQGLIDRDDEGGGVDVFEVHERIPIRGQGQPPGATGSGQGCPPFRIGENAGRRRV